MSSVAESSKAAEAATTADSPHQSPGSAAPVISNLISKATPLPLAKEVTDLEGVVTGQRLDEVVIDLTDVPEGFSDVSMGHIKEGKRKKATGDKIYAFGDFRSAMRNYHEAILYYRAIEKANHGGLGPQESGDEKSKETRKAYIDGLMEKVFNNLAACHIRLKNWPRVVQTADKALEKNPDNLKASLRKAKGLNEQGLVEKQSIPLLEKLLEKHPNDPDVKAEHAKAKRLLAEQTKDADKVFKGMFNTDKGKAPETPSGWGSTTASGSSTGNDAGEPVETPLVKAFDGATIEEVKDD